MIEVNVDSIRVSLMSHHRVVILKAIDRDTYLPIWIGPFEADAITAELQGMEVSRPMTHDILRNVIETMKGEVRQIVISDLRNDTFYARILIDQDGEELEIDSRPSDALALAVRVRVPIYVDEDVMSQAGVVPEGEDDELDGDALPDDAPSGVPADEEELSAFSDFLDSLDLDDLTDDN